jgi:hypothetical protein
MFKKRAILALLREGKEQQCIMQLKEEKERIDKRLSKVRKQIDVEEEKNMQMTK